MVDHQHYYNGTTFVACIDTRIIPEKDVLYRSQCSQETSVNINCMFDYIGVITDHSSLLVNASFILNDEYTVYLMGYGSSDFGRSLRRGAKIKISNAHCVYNLNIIACCMYTTVRVLSFSEIDAEYSPLVLKYVPLHNEAFTVLPTLYPHYILYEKLLQRMIEKKFSKWEHKNTMTLMRRFFDYYDCDHHYPITQRFLYEQFVNHDFCCNIIEKGNVNVENVVTLHEVVEFIINLYKSGSLSFPCVINKDTLNKDWVMICNVHHVHDDMWALCDKSGELDCMFLVDNMLELDTSIHKDDVYHIVDYRLILDVVEDVVTCFVQVLNMERVVAVSNNLSLSRADDQIKILCLSPYNNNSYKIKCKENSMIQCKEGWHWMYQILKRHLHQFICGELVIQNNKICKHEKTNKTSILSVKDVILTHPPVCDFVCGLLIEKSQITQDQSSNHRVFLLKLRDVNGPEVIGMYYKIPAGIKDDLLRGLIPKHVLLTCYNVSCKKSASTSQYYLNFNLDKSIIVASKYNPSNQNINYKSVEVVNMKYLEDNKDCLPSIVYQIKSCVITNVYKFNVSSCNSCDVVFGVHDGTGKCSVVIKDVHVLVQIAPDAMNIGEEQALNSTYLIHLQFDLFAKNITKQGTLRLWAINTTPILDHWQRCRDILSDILNNT
ncbi:hypothetical protein AKO1_012871 [Acrasis kona]|uniref:CST complex subunit CTC1 n=1 Tax=Acrasis kona TaxID=1008807 RepID=A0AAW2YVW4_9EUKA